MHPGLADVEKVAQVAGEQIPAEKVRLVAVITVNYQAADPPRLEQGTEHLQVLEVAENLLALLRGERLIHLVTTEDRGRVGGVTGERVEGGVGVHNHHGTEHGRGLSETGLDTSPWDARPVSTLTTPQAATSGLDGFFRMSQRGSSPGREVRGGFATFFTMAYIIVLNPIILGSATDKFGAQLSIPQLTTATALVAAVMTIVMGVGGNLPLAIAAGLGLNGVVAFQIAPTMSWRTRWGWSSWREF